LVVCGSGAVVVVPSWCAIMCGVQLWWWLLLLPFPPLLLLPLPPLPQVLALLLLLALPCAAAAAVAAGLGLHAPWYSTGNGWCWWYAGGAGAGSGGGTGGGSGVVVLLRLFHCCLLPPLPQALRCCCWRCRPLCCCLALLLLLLHTKVGRGGHYRYCLCGVVRDRHFQHRLRHGVATRPWLRNTDSVTTCNSGRGCATPTPIYGSPSSSSASLRSLSLSTVQFISHAYLTYIVVIPSRVFLRVFSLDPPC